MMTATTTARATVSTNQIQAAPILHLDPSPHTSRNVEAHIPATDLSLIVAAVLSIPHKSIHHAFLAQATSAPKQIAVIDDSGRSLTYREVDVLSAHLATALRSHGVGRGSYVCLVVERSASYIISILAVLRAGAAYIPLDGRIVTDISLVSVLQDARPVFTLISKCHLGWAKHIFLPYACLEDMITQSQCSDIDPECEFVDDVDPSDSAYVIYTSGTTGRPKGVVVKHSNVTNLLCLSPGNLGIRPGVRVAQLLNVGFDMCAWETLACLMNGGTLYLRGPRRSDWIEVMKTVDVVVCTPSILEAHDPRDFPNIRTIATAGEPCSQSLADKWSMQSTFYNCCGPTEVTIVNTMHLHRTGMPLTIGKPTLNNAVYILDSNLNPVPRGTSGIIWAGGLGVCKGYLNRPGLNQTKFHPDPFSPLGGMMYNTGDIGRLRDDGEIDHLGRIDDQVKVKGFRVELDGVSAAIRTCPGITSACTLLVGQELWAFLSPEHIPSEEVLRFVSCWNSIIQPYYAIPARYKALPSMPLTSNGKIDKAFLRRLAELDK